MTTITVTAATRGGQKQPLPRLDTLSPQQLREWVIQRGRPGGGGYCAECAGQQRQPVHPDTLLPQQIRASESDAALGASASAAALGVSASTATGPASAEALHNFTLDSGASRCFFCDCTEVTPLAAPVPVSLADLSRGPVVARASTVLPCPAVPSGVLSGLHLPSFSTNLVSNAVLQDALLDTFTPGGQRVSIRTCSGTGRHLATFTRQPGSSLYTLTTASAQVATSGQVAASSKVSASGQLAASFSCQVLSHQTLLWHHRLGHPSLPCLRSMHSRLLVSGLPRSLPPLPRSLAPPCLPCVEGRQRAAPHSSEFPPTTAPLQTLHMDVWGPAPVHGMDQERYFLMVVDDYTQGERPRGGKFSSGLLAAFCRDEGIVYSCTLAVSPHKNGIAERCIGLIMELNLWPRVSVPETSPTLSWTGEVGDASAFHVWGELSLVRDTTASKLSPRTLRCAFLGFPTDAPSWQFYPPRSRRILSSQDITIDESDYFYRLHPHASHPPLVISSDNSGLAEGGDLAAEDTATTHRSPRLETPPGFPPRPSSPPLQPLAVDTGAAWGGDTGGEDTGGAGLGGAGPGGAGPGGAETGDEGSGGAYSGGSDSGGADSGGAASPSGGGVVGAPTAGPGAGQQQQPTAGPGSAGAVGAGGTTGAAVSRAGGTGGTEGAGAAGPRGARTRGAGAAGAGGATGAGGAGGATRAAGTGGAGGTAGAGGAGARGTGGTRGAGVAGAGGAAGVGGEGGAIGATGAGGAGAAGAGGAGAANDTAQCHYELHSFDFSTAFLQGSLHEEIWLRRPPGFTGSFPVGTQWSLRRPVYDTSRPPFYVLVYVDDLVFSTADTEALALVKAELQEKHTCTDLGELRSYLGLRITLAPPFDKSVEPSGPYPELVGYLMYLMTCTRSDLAYPLSLLACYVAPGRHRKVHWDAAKRVLRYLCRTSSMGLELQGRGSVVLAGHSDASWANNQATQRSSHGYTFSLGSGSVSWRSTHSSSVLGSSCEAEIFTGAMAAQELRWLSYLLTDLGERPRSPPVLYANSADVFTKALGSGDHQRFCTALGLLPILHHLLVS
ncbi:unnamed protein product [Closterium sp. NIES-53]